MECKVRLSVDRAAKCHLLRALISVIEGVTADNPTASQG